MIHATDTDLRIAIEACRANGGGEISLDLPRHTLPGGYQTPLIHGWAIRGEGSTQIELVGNGDVTIGDPAGGEMRNFLMEGAEVVTASQRGGWALHLRKLVRSALRDVIVDPVEQGWLNQFGIWIDGFDSVTLDRVTVNARTKSLLVNGMRDQSYGADLYVCGGGKYTTERVVEQSPGEAAVHIAGAAGGVLIEATDIIYSDVCLLIDTTMAGVPNREIFLGAGCYLDSADSDCLRLGPKACSTLQANGAWMASAGLTSGGYPNGNGVNVHYDNAQLVGVLSGCRVFNHKGTGVALSGGHWRVGGTTAIYNNGGYGIDKPNSAAAVEAGDLMMFANAMGNTHGF